MPRGFAFLMSALVLMGQLAVVKSDAEIKAFLPKLLQPGQRFANVDPQDGQQLHDLVVRLKARRVLEVGTSTGYSGIWMAMGLRKTGGRLISLEVHEGRYSSARQNFAAVGLEGVADLRLADAVDAVKEIEGPFDLVFLDAGKSDYLHYYEQLLPKLRTGGVIAAHNVKSRSADMTPFLEKIRSDSRVRTEFFTGSPQGLSISYKR
jgi:caffeoyl-CoA O-methyltransferase